MKSASINLIITIFLILVVQPAAADGFIVVPDSPLPVTSTTGHFPLEVRYHHVDVEINGRTAVTRVDQEFYNPSQYLLEGEYIFPIPKGAVINKFSMYINGQYKKIVMDLVPLTPVLIDYYMLISSRCSQDSQF